MILPAAYWISLLVLFVSMLCWGSWANTLKKSAWRFELLYMDFAVGCVLTATVAAFTLGSMGSDISVQDNFLLAGKKQWALAFAAGCLFNLANMMLVAAMELAGMSVAFPLGMGLALVVGAVWNFVAGKGPGAVFVFGGSALLLVAVVMGVLALSGLTRLRRAAEKAALDAQNAQNNEGPLANPNVVKSKKASKNEGPSPWLGVTLALLAGVFLGAFYPLVDAAMEGDLGLNNPYALALLFAGGILVSTFIYNLYFMNLPVKGLPVGFFAYFTGTLQQHALGLLGGALWMIGGLANFSGAAATGAAKVAPGMSVAVGHGAAIIAFLWGYQVWKEFEGADGAVRSKLMLMAGLLLAGWALLSFAPVA